MAILLTENFLEGNLNLWTSNTGNPTISPLNAYTGNSLLVTGDSCYVSLLLATAIQTCATRFYAYFTSFPQAQGYSMALLGVSGSTYPNYGTGILVVAGTDPQTATIGLTDNYGVVSGSGATIHLNTLYFVELDRSTVPGGTTTLYLSQANAPNPTVINTATAGIGQTDTIHLGDVKDSTLGATVYISQIEIADTGPIGPLPTAPWTLNITAGTGGTVSPIGPITGNPGTQTPSITATANSGYTFTNWTLDGAVTSTVNPLAFIISDSHTHVLAANFTSNTPPPPTTATLTINSGPITGIIFSVT